MLLLQMARGVSRTKNGVLTGPNILCIDCSRNLLVVLCVLVAEGLHNLVISTLASLESQQKYEIWRLRSSGKFWYQCWRCEDMPAEATPRLVKF